MIKNILEYFEATAARRPDRTAVVDGERTVTFRELCRSAKALAWVIRGRTGGQIRRPVGVYLGKSIESVTADIAAVWSGNAYMNLDIKTPLSRIRNILELAEPILVITDPAHREALREVWPEEKTLCLGEGEEDGPWDEAALAEVLEGIIDTDPLCLINTSGSTGTPKGVVLCHRSFIDFTEWAFSTTGIGQEEVIGSLSPIVFDIYSFELCMLMAGGSTLVVIPDSWAAFPAKILELLREREITYLFWVPTIMVNIANMGLLDRIQLPSLRWVWFAGEVFPTKQFNVWRSRLPGVRFINLYGPIEITLDCTYFIVDRPIPDDEPIPIGFPCRNTDVLVLTQEDRPAGPGEEGELCVRGSSLALGYYNDPEKTAAAFVQNPLNSVYPEVIYRTGDMVCTNDRGELVFKGRKDTLVKHSGYRIELGEIEHVVVNTLQLVKNGCAVYDYSGKEIVFFYEAPEELPVAGLRKAILTALPGYMVPGRFVRMEELPRNTNGKIDRLALKNQVNP